MDMYNPVGHDGWLYSQTDGEISEYAFNKLWDKAESLFMNEQYAQSMDILKQLMMLKPEENAAFENYATCLYNLGMYEEALTATEICLEYWPDEEYALGLKHDILVKLEESNYVEENDNVNYSVWDALGDFSNALMQITGQSSDGYYTPQYSLSGNYGVQDYHGGASGNFEAQYRNWERRAEQCYESLTNTGYSATSKSGRKRGSTGQGMSSGNYVQMKRSLREAQREMKNIRTKAAKNGVTIKQSRWENVTVGY